MTPRTIAQSLAAVAAAPLIAAKVHASHHRAQLEASTRCGCFFCFRAFATSEIRAWIDGNKTALCPSCGVDAVLGDASGSSISDGFLRKMHQYHFPHRTK